VNGVCCGGRDLCKGSIPHTGKFYHACTRTHKHMRVHVRVPLSVISCNNSPLHLQWVGRRGLRKKEGNIHMKHLEIKVRFWILITVIKESDETNTILIM